MILQRWSSKIQPMQLPAFLDALKELNEQYRAHDRVPWSRVHWVLHSGHQVSMERVFTDLVALEADESSSLEPEIWELKVGLLDSTVPGTVSIEHFHLLESL